jgi:hypothetical protein
MRNIYGHKHQYFLRNKNNSLEKIVKSTVWELQLAWKLDFHLWRGFVFCILIHMSYVLGGVTIFRLLGLGLG